MDNMVRNQLCSAENEQSPSTWGRHIQQHYGIKELSGAKGTVNRQECVRSPEDPARTSSNEFHVRSTMTVTEDDNLSCFPRRVDNKSPNTRFMLETSTKAIKHLLEDMYECLNI